MPAFAAKNKHFREMKKNDNDILFDEKGFPAEAADRKFQAIPIVAGDDVRHCLFHWSFHKSC